MAMRSPVGRLFSFLPRYSIRHPVRVLVIAGLLTLAAAPGALRLKLRTDGHALVAEQAPEVRYDRAVRAEFGLEDAIVVLIRSPHPDGIFNPATLQRVRELTVKLGALEGIHPANLFSLATERGFRNRPGTFEFQTFLETPRTTKAELEQLRDDLRRIKLYTGTLVSQDGTATAILIGAPPGRDRTELCREIGDVVAAQEPMAEEIFIIGAPVAEALLGAHILQDLGVPRALLGTGGVLAESAAWTWPRSFYDLRVLIAQHLGLLPVALFLMGLIFYLSFRSVAGVMLPLMEVGACLVVTFGLMGWLGVPIYLTIAVMPVMLTAMGISDEIYVFSRYAELLRERPGMNHGELVALTMEEKWRPVLNTAATTAIGFLSFAFSPLRPVQAFGIFTAFGILFCLLWTLTVIPALLVLLNPARFVLRQPGRAAVKVAPENSWLGQFARGVLRWRTMLLVAAVVLVALAPLGVRRLVVQDSWIDGFDPGSPFRRATEWVNEQFRGTHMLLVTVEGRATGRQGIMPLAATEENKITLPGGTASDPAELVQNWITVSIAPQTANTNPPARRRPAAWSSWIQSADVRDGKLLLTTPPADLSPKFYLLPTSNEVLRYELRTQPFMTEATLRRVAALETFIEGRRERAVGGVLGPASYVATSSFMARPLDEANRRIPSTPPEIRGAWGNYQLARGVERLRQAVDTNYARGVITVFMRNANFVDTAKLMEDIRRYEREQLTPHGLKLGFAGDVAVSQSLIRGIVNTQVQSLLWSLLGILLVTSVLARSIRWGVYCVLPSALAVLVNFAVMGWLGMPLGVATSMFAGMTLGMGVDFAIHLLESFETEHATGLAADAALIRAVAKVGPAVLINAGSVAVGFGVLMLSQVPANARLGALVVLGIGNCLLASLLVLPVIFRLWPPRASTGRNDPSGPVVTQPSGSDVSSK